ncbi:hypothetical protein AXG93_3426s1090 [Marchantia polymorpha subsp. ruderalis]|uniref:Nucleoside diphosphate kinase n=1 Tax=Marchantia polymorpha subsp. ruderalis TaxID=1480154 RepID=A0A176VF40_MARPO|nr:hypothetical protein AXG93_3426s1090 [Marchantia polymorpha subsp. ruderalis]
MSAAACRHSAVAPAVTAGKAWTNSSYGTVLSTAAFLSASVYTFVDQELSAAELERTFIAIKPDGVQRGLISDIIARFEKKGYKLVAIKLVHPTKDFAEKHYDDLKGRPFFNGLTDFLSSGPVVAMVPPPPPSQSMSNHTADPQVWEGQGVIKYGRKFIGATAPLASEPGTIRGDFAISVGRNIIHGSDGPETAKDEIALWFKPEEILSYKKETDKWLYE